MFHHTDGFFPEGEEQGAASPSSTACAGGPHEPIEEQTGCGDAPEEETAFDSAEPPLESDDDSDLSSVHSADSLPHKRRKLEQAEARAKPLIEGAVVAIEFPHSPLRLLRLQDLAFVQSARKAPAGRDLDSFFRPARCATELKLHRWILAKFPNPLVVDALVNDIGRYREQCDPDLAFDFVQRPDAAYVLILRGTQHHRAAPLVHMLQLGRQVSLEVAYLTHSVGRRAAQRETLQFLRLWAAFGDNHLTTMLLTTAGP